MRRAIVAWRVTPLAPGERMDRRSPESGRWHRGDKPVVYASTTPELAALEALAHLQAPVQTHALVRLKLQGVRMKRIRGLPHGWKQAKHLTRRIGEAWLASGGEHALMVPSALCDGASNVLIASARLPAGALAVHRVGPFRFDRRLLAGIKPADWEDA